MIKIGITGQSGFIGTHLYNTLGLYTDKFERIPFEDKYFSDHRKLSNFAAHCDVIVHLAAMNRHQDPDVLYKTNIGLVNKLIEVCETTHSTPHIVFSSSIQEERNNLYGQSKKKGRFLFEQWAKRNHARFTGLIIPNVFGPFGNPYYNSVVATFCYQLTHNEQPKIEVDGDIKMIFVSELVQNFIQLILKRDTSQDETTLSHIESILISPTSEINVSSLLQKLRTFQENYFENGAIPDLDNTFDRNLFNTFLCYIDHSLLFPFRLKLITDQRGSFIETIKLNSGGQVSFSTTVPGVTRGNHFHTRKAERFAVIKGKARIEFRRIGTNKILSFELDGKVPSFVDMPIWHTHNITNIGEEDLYTIFWINEHFKANDTDTYFEKV